MSFFLQTHIGCDNARHMARSEIMRVVKDTLYHGKTAECSNEGPCGDLPSCKWFRSFGAVSKPVADPWRKARKTRLWHQDVASEPVYDEKVETKAIVLLSRLISREKRNEKLVMISNRP